MHVVVDGAEDWHAALRISHAPDLKLVAVSNGTPTAAASTPARSVTCGSRMNVRIPANRG